MIAAALRPPRRRAGDAARRSVYTFVPGNLTELLLSFDLLPVLPEINALQSAMRGKTAEYIAIAEKHGHSEDVCTYVKSDIGMMKSGNIGPTGQRLPKPDLLLLSYTGCFTFMKWFELLREEYQLPGGDAARALPGATAASPTRCATTSSKQLRSGRDPEARGRQRAAPTTRTG